MAPEQAAGDPIDHRTDLYTLGCLAYELLTGRPPFTAASAQALIAAHLADEPEPVANRRPDMPRALAALVMRLLEKRREARPHSADEVLRALDTVEVGFHARPLSGAIWTPRRLPGRVATLGLGFLLGLGVLFAWLRTRPEVEAGPKRVAVLPFENLGDTSMAYFADGITDVVRGKLAALPDLQVTASSSSSQYKKTTKSPQQIGQELGVQYLLVGTVRWQKDASGASRVRVSPELVEVGTASTRWQQPFDAALTDVFQVQTNLAGQVAQALDVALDASARARLSERATANLAAYDAFLKGEDASGGVGTADNVTLRRALPYYERAVALDSTFALAWAQLSRAHSIIYLNGEPSPGEAKAARQAADRVLVLAPGRPEARLALGDYYADVLHDPRLALEQFELGLRVAPRSAELLTHSAFAEQDLGRWEAALHHFQRAHALDPRSVGTTQGLARALLWLRRYSEALQATERGLGLAPTDLRLLQARSMVHVARGDLGGAQAVLRAAPKEVEPTALVAYMGYYWDLYWVLDEPQQALLLRLSPNAFDENRASWGLVLAQTYALRGDTMLARVYADSARLTLREQVRAAPADAQLHVLHGLALAYLGRRAEAVREGKRGVALVPATKNAYAGAYFQHQLARIYLLVGEPEKALDWLEPLLKLPYYLSPGWLRIDPTFDPLRDNPRFQRLVSGS
jgi:serine/threonine-protein kinase